ncbi:hypothetical protein ACQP2T_47000 [Nonomuraea sp. CA-143628]|uniref:hypothetical protein n=1 Tax=Nonomuraea sp. CA-143628 TaxID=3239997 RepID=UPI003D928F73
MIAMNRRVRAATMLMWSILPFGAIVTALNIAVCASVEAVARKALSQNRDYLDYGMAHFDAVAWGRTQGIAVFFVLAALAIGAIAWLIRRQQRSDLIALLVGPLSLTYVFWLWHVHKSNPVADDVLWKVQELDPALPLTSDTLLPGAADLVEGAETESSGRWRVAWQGPGAHRARVRGSVCRDQLRRHLAGRSVSRAR